MSQSITVGLVVTSHNAAAVNTAAFDRITVDRLAPGPLSPTEIVIYADDVL
jgi:hypothetical protein